MFRTAPKKNYLGLSQLALKAKSSALTPTGPFFILILIYLFEIYRLAGSRKNKLNQVLSDVAQPNITKITNIS